MKCFKHLCAKCFFGFVIFSGWGFTLNASAAEVAVETAEPSAIEDTNAAGNIDALEPAPSMQELQLARAQDVDWLSRIIQPEAGNAFEDKVCVGLTVLYRVSSPDFPNTVKENIELPSQYTKPTKGEVLPINLMAAEYAMQLWESGASYAVLPAQYMYFVGDGRKNKFHDSHGHYHDLPKIDPENLTLPYTQGPNGALIS